MESVRRIDLRDTKDMECSKSKLETFLIHIIANADMGEEIEVVVGKEENFKLLKEMGEDYGYEVLKGWKEGEKEYILRIRII